jgi:hypothetical protein
MPLLQLVLSAKNDIIVTAVEATHRGPVELERLLKSRKVCTLKELMAELGTRVRMTVWRKLAQLPYLSSYSDRGRFYALKSSCEFDRSGL